MISFKSFSQNVTESTSILLTKPVARLVVKDLVSYDGLLAESQLTQQRLLTLSDKVLTLEDVINNLNKQIENRNQVIQQKDTQLQTYERLSDDLQKALRREQKTKKLYKIGSAVGVAAILMNAIGK